MSFLPPYRYHFFIFKFELLKSVNSLSSTHHSLQSEQPGTCARLLAPILLLPSQESKNKNKRRQRHPFQIISTNTMNFLRVYFVCPSENRIFLIPEFLQNYKQLHCLCKRLEFDHSNMHKTKAVIMNKFRKLFANWKFDRKTQFRIKGQVQ